MTNSFKTECGEKKCLHLTSSPLLPFTPSGFIWFSTGRDDNSKRRVGPGLFWRWPFVRTVCLVTVSYCFVIYSILIYEVTFLSTDRSFTPSIHSVFQVIFKIKWPILSSSTTAPVTRVSLKDFWTITLTKPKRVCMSKYQPCLQVPMHDSLQSFDEVLKGMSVIKTQRQFLKTNQH